MPKFVVLYNGKEDLPVETIAEKFHLSKEYVLSVLQEPMYVSEAKVPYINAKAQTE